jgi:hypothetical protein
MRDPCSQYQRDGQAEGESTPHRVRGYLGYKALSRDAPIVVKARRYDIDTMPDDQISDAIRADLTVTPRVLLTSGWLVPPHSDLPFPA